MTSVHGSENSPSKVSQDNQAKLQTPTAVNPNNMFANLNIPRYVPLIDKILPREGQGIGLTGAVIP